MPGPRALKLRLTRDQLQELVVLTRQRTAEYRQVQRAAIVLAAARGEANETIAATLGVSVPTVRLWRNRYASSPGVRALADAKRSGRPPTVPVAVRCELVKLACDRPEKTPFREVWTHETLRKRLWAETGVWVSTSEIGRILRDAELRPHVMRLWLHSPDPEFKSKVKRICDLYVSPPPGATVLCVDEKTCIQALQHKHPLKRSTPGRCGRKEFEYVRHGTTTLLAAFDVRTGRVFGRCKERRTANDLLAFMDELAAAYPGGDVYVVWDNLNIHTGDRWAAFNARHGGRFHFVFTPKHASWVNQIEVWFSILQRRVLKHASFVSVLDLKLAVLGFVLCWNELEAHPFRWTFRGRFAQHPDRAAA